MRLNEQYFILHDIVKNEMKKKIQKNTTRLEQFQNPNGNSI